MNLAKSLLLLIIAAATASAAEVANCARVAGWKQDGASRTFTAENLYEYVDGDAEGYLIYDFVRMQNLTCKSGANTLVIDVSEMSDSEGAYGLFLARLDPRRPVAPLGMGGQIQSQRAAFAKDKYYVEMNATPDKDHSPALEAFVTAIAAEIHGRSTPPETASWFSTEKLVSLRLIPQSVLGLRVLKRGYVAQYEEGRTFIVAEESPAAAAAVLHQLRDRFGSTTTAAVGDEGIEAKDKYLGCMCIFRKGRYLAGSANLPDSSQALALAQALAAGLP